MSFETLVFRICNKRDAENKFGNDRPITSPNILARQKIRKHNSVKNALRLFAQTEKMRFLGFGRGAEMKKCVFLLLGRVPNGAFGDFWLWAKCRSRYNPNLAFGQSAEVGKVQSFAFGRVSEAKKERSLKSAARPKQDFAKRLCEMCCPKRKKGGFLEKECKTYRTKSLLQVYFYKKRRRMCFFVIQNDEIWRVYEKKDGVECGYWDNGA